MGKTSKMTTHFDPGQSKKRTAFPPIWGKREGRTAAAAGAAAAASAAAAAKRDKRSRSQHRSSNGSSSSSSGSGSSGSGSNICWSCAKAVVGLKKFTARKKKRGQDRPEHHHPPPPPRAPKSAPTLYWQACSWSEKKKGTPNAQSQQTCPVAWQTRTLGSDKMPDRRCPNRRPRRGPPGLTRPGAGATTRGWALRATTGPAC